MIGGAAAVCLCLTGITACGETNNITQRNGRDGTVCVDAECPQAPVSEAAGESRPPTAPSEDRRAGAEPAAEDTALPQAGPETADSGSQEGPGQDVTASAQVRYLTDVDPIGGYGNWTREDVAVVAENVLSQSIVFAPSLFSQAPKKLAFKVPSGLGGFRATIGLDDETLPGYVAQVLITRQDGSTVAGRTLRPGEPFEVTESVAGAGTITITLSIVEWASDAVNSRPHVVVGDGRFVAS